MMQCFSWWCALLRDLGQVVQLQAHVLTESNSLYVGIEHTKVQEPNAVCFQ